MRFAPILPKNTQLNLAFSCGKDSIAIAHFLRNKARKKVKLYHVNNGLVGDDIIQQKSILFANHFDFDLECILSPAMASENECREARIKALSHLNHIIVCHHLGDAVEQYLFNIFRGHQNYTPMRFKSSWGNCAVLRPFLKVNPQEIENYNTQEDLNKYIAEDFLSKQSKRHWLRKTIIPEINSNGYNLFKTVKKLIT